MGRWAVFLLFAAVALAIDVEWNAHDRSLDIRDYGKDATFASASNSAACERAARVTDGAIRLRLNDFVSSCSAERTAALGDSFVSVYASADSSLLVCTGRRSAAEIRSLRLTAAGIEFSLLGGTSVEGGRRLRSTSPKRSDWLVASWKDGVEFSSGGSMQCRVIPGAAALVAAKRGAPLAMKNKKSEAAGEPSPKKKKSAVATLRLDVGGCVRLPVRDGWTVRLDRIELCLANSKEAVCHNVRDSTEQDNARVCVSDLRRLASEMHSRNEKVTGAAADTRVQLQYSYTLKRGAELLKDRRAVGRIGTANAKRFSPLSECSADDCDVDGDVNSDFVVLTPVSNWVLFAVIIVSAALFLILIFYLVADHFKLRDERRTNRRSHI